MKTLNIFLITFLFFAFHANANTEKYRLMFNDDPATTITVAWNQISGSNPEVYYGTTDFGTTWASYPNNSAPYRTTNYMGMSNQFVKITGLTPNTAYYFVIKDSQGTSDRYWFKTCPNVNTEKLSFISGGDSRSGQTQRINSNKMVAKIRPHAVLFGGDLVNSPANSSYQAWFDDWQHATTSDGQMIPLVHSFGNHEAYGSGGPNCIRDLFDTSYDVYYNIVFGGDLFSMYTLNGELLPGHTIANASKRTAQTNWLSSTLTVDNAIWKGVQYHRPIVPHYAGKGEGTDEFNDWAQLFYDNGVRLVMESDAHVVKITEEVKPVNSTASGSSSTWFTSTGLALNKGMTFIGEGSWGTIRTPDDSHPMTTAMGSFYSFNWVTIDQCRMEIRTVDTQNPNGVAEHVAGDYFSISAGLDAQLWKPTAMPTGIREIVLCASPVTDFVANQTNIFTGTTVNFTDLSSSSPTSWLWDFGDGGTSTQQNPSYQYNTSGVYTVALTATNIDGSSVETKVAYITVNTPSAPSAEFSADATTVPLGNPSNFTDLSTGISTSWLWDFGDGNNSTTQNPSHTYLAAGAYTVTLTATNAYGNDVEVKTNYINVVNGGTISVSIINGNDDVEEFNSNGNMYFNSSDLELCYDGGNSENQHVGLRFQNIILPKGAIISNAHIEMRADETDNTNLDIYITGVAEDNAAAWASTNYDVSNRGVTTANITWVHDNSTAWSAGSTIGQTPDMSSIVQEIVARCGWESGNSMSFVFTDNGSEHDERVADSYEGGYPATLVFDYALPGVLVPSAAFTVNTTTTCVGVANNFTDQSTNTPTSWGWDFGDGNSSNSQNPSHTYTSNGTYTVELITANASGCDIISNVNYVTVNVLPTVVAAGTSTICDGDNVTISASGANTYTWDNSLGAGSSQSISPSTNTTYTVTGIDANNCENTDQVTISVNALPTVVAAGTTMICDGDNVTISASGANTYTWDNSLGAGSSQSISPSTNTTYTVTGIDANNCENTDQVTISVNALPIVAMGVFNPNTICSTASNFTLPAGTPSGGSYSGIGVNGNSFEPVNAGLGLHTVTYTVMDGNGCENTANQSVEIQICTGIIDNTEVTYKIYPNPVSNILFFEFPETVSVNLTIFDIRGKLVHSSIINQSKTNINVSNWTPGTYVVIIEGMDGNRVNKHKVIIK